MQEDITRYVYWTKNALNISTPRAAARAHSRPGPRGRTRRRGHYTHLEDTLTIGGPGLRGLFLRPEDERDTIRRAKEACFVNTDDRISVLHLLPPSTGGMRTHVLTLLDHFDRRRFDITLAAPAAVQQSITEERLRGARFDALELAEVAEPLGLVYGSLHLSALLHRRKTHILHSHGVRAMLAAGPGERTAPVRVATLHHPLSAGLSPAARHMVAYAYKTQTHCIATGQAIRTICLRWASRKSA